MSLFFEMFYFILFEVVGWSWVFSSGTVIHIPENIMTIQLQFAIDVKVHVRYIDVPLYFNSG